MNLYNYYWASAPINLEQASKNSIVWCLWAEGGPSMFSSCSISILSPGSTACKW